MTQRQAFAYGRRVIIESESDESSSDDSSLIRNTSITNNEPVQARQRSFSNDSFLSDSSSSLEGKFREALSISNFLLSKSPVEVDILDSDADSDSNDLHLQPAERNSLKAHDVEESTGMDDDGSQDMTSAWARKLGSTDFILSSEKLPGSSWPNFCLPSPLYQQLFSFQRQGVQWMSSLHCAGIGGILGDDMGMGKTYVTLSYLGGLMRAETIRNALVIAPLSVLHSWKNEAQKIIPQCVSSVKITVLNSEISRRQRLNYINTIARGSAGTAKYHLVITTYGLIRSATQDFSSGSGRTLWHYVVLDEGHNIKNAAADVSKACRSVCSDETRRILLTGTPILNNLKELWSLFDFATNGKVLGNSKNFYQYFAKPIEAARDRLATRGAIELGQRKNKELQELIRPYFLQRLKVDFLKDRLPQKHDIVVWTHLSGEQRRLYQEFVESGDSVVRSILTGEKKSPLEGITWLKKLCGHPLLTETDGEKRKIRRGRPEELLNESAKLQLLVDLVQHLKENGNRALIFSQSTKMLDIIALVLRDLVYFARIDGSTPGNDRQRLVDDFNREGSHFDVMLLSTKAAGCGLTLTGADTAIVYDPSWTPADDAQAVDRCYRIGQKKEVTVYRLIAAGTVEEKIYEKQIHKDGIRRAVLSQDEQIERYFGIDELRSLFKLGPPGECSVMDKLKHSRKPPGDRYNFVLHLQSVVGISRHDGFYETNNGSDKAAFDGTAPTPTPKKVGKSQRIMDRASNNEIVAQDHPVGQGTSSKALPPGNERPQSKDARITVPTNKPPPTNVIVLDEAEGDSEPDSVGVTQYTWGEGDNEDIIQKVIFSAEHHFELMHHRKCLELLLDVVETGNLKGNQKISVHRHIAKVAQILGLL